MIQTDVFHCIFCVCTYNAKHAANNIQGVQKIFDKGFTNYRCVHRNFLERKKVKQESLNFHFTEVNHYGEDDWEARLMNLIDNVEELKKT